MIIDGITEESSVEALVLSVQGQVSRIAYQYSRPVAGLGHEDLISVGMVKAVSAAERLPGLGVARCPEARNYTYLVVAARNAIIGQFREGYGDPLGRPSKVHPAPLVSLDGNADFSLYETLPSPHRSSKSRNFSLLYDAINTLPDVYRDVICMKFGLCGYSVHRTGEIALLIQRSCSTVCWRIQRGLALLREHTELRDLVTFREVQG